jgi:general transcription factor 3C polypeptide 3 (transcription factor C subunit 4)
MDPPPLRGRGQNRQHQSDSPVPGPRQSKADKAANRNLTKKILEDQMRSAMQSLWQQVQSAERGIEASPPEEGALERFIQSAGTMIENYRLARTNFTKGGVSYTSKASAYK